MLNVLLTCTAQSSGCSSELSVAFAAIFLAPCARLITSACCLISMGIAENLSGLGSAARISIESALVVSVASASSLVGVLLAGFVPRVECGIRLGKAPRAVDTALLILGAEGLFHAL